MSDNRLNRRSSFAQFAIKSSFVDLDGWKNGGVGLFGVVFKGRLLMQRSLYKQILNKILEVCLYNQSIIKKYMIF
jgi:hypothetical protein